MARKKPPPRSPQLKLAGAFCVAFVNTAGARPDNGQQGVEDYGELVTWGQQAGVVSALEAERLRRLATERPADATAVLARAASLRVVLSRLFLAMMRGKDLPRPGLDAFNAALREALPALRVVPGEIGVTWGWEGDEEALDRVLWPVAHSAAETLIAAAGRPHVRQCAARGCRLWFVDRSPSGQRRWCEMKTCGNRAKTRTYYERKGRRERAERMRGAGYWRTRRPRTTAST